MKVIRNEMNLQYNEGTQKWEPCTEPFATIYLSNADEYEVLMEAMNSAKRVRKALEYIDMLMGITDNEQIRLSCAKIKEKLTKDEET